MRNNICPDKWPAFLRPPGGLLVLQRCQSSFLSPIVIVTTCARPQILRTKCRITKNKGFVLNSELDSKHKVFTENWNMFTNYIDISNSAILGAEPVFKRWIRIKNVWKIANQDTYDDTFLFQRISSSPLSDCHSLSLNDYHLSFLIYQELSIVPVTISYSLDMFFYGKETKWEVLRAFQFTRGRVNLIKNKPKTTRSILGVTH